MINFDRAEVHSKPYQHFDMINCLDIDFFLPLQEEIRRIFDRSDEIFFKETNVRHDESFPAGTNMYLGGSQTATGIHGKEGKAVDILLAVSKKGGPLEKMLAYLTLDQTQEKLYRLLIPRTLKDISSLKPLKVHSSNSKVSLFDFIFFRNCYMSVKLSSYDSNAGLFQHVDHGQKVISLLFYLGYNDDIVRNEGGTQVYGVAKGEDLLSKGSISTLDYLEEKKLILKKNISPVPNRLFGFRPSKISWHAVAPVILPKGVMRETLQVNLMKSYNFSSSIVRWLFELKRKVNFRTRIRRLFST